MSSTRFLSSDILAERVVACLGLVSDTHMPQRCAELPAGLFRALEGVDLLLHAGDVGELRVLDRLAAIAPVVAVHGNDDTAESQRELPYQQVLAIAGRRVLLCHSHDPDHVQELASRRDDAWGPKLEHRAAHGRRAGAGVYVHGHTHIPMARRQDGVLLVNPGAIASPNAVTRQRLRTVARLYLLDGGSAIVVHVDLTTPDRPYTPRVDWQAGFRAALAQVSDSILSPELAADWERLAGRVRALAPEAAGEALLRAARRCWSGERNAITRDDLLTELRAEPALPPEVLEELDAEPAPPP